MRISDWSSDVCSSDLHISPPQSRRRASLRAARFGKKLHMGFSSENSHRIVDMDMCIMLHPSLFALVEPLRGLLFDLVEDRRAAHIRMTLTDQGVDLLQIGRASVRERVCPSV